MSLKRKASLFSTWTDSPGPIADPASRLRKATKIKAVVHAERALPNRSAVVLDIGCSFGHILKHLSDEAGYCIGIDLDPHALKSGAEGIAYLQADGEHLPLASGSIDIVICNHVYEHTDSAPALMDEIYRVLKTGGLCYFGAPNRFNIIEPHYRLPFLAWLPQSWADRYVRWAGKGSGYPERPYSHKALLRLAEAFEIIDYTPTIISDPAHFHLDDLLPPGSLKQIAARAIYRFARFIFPDFIFILRKKA